MSFDFGDVVLVPFPFADQSGVKKRPAVIVSSMAYHAQRRDLVIMAITGQIRPHPAFAEFTLAEWKKAGLLVPSAVKPILTTIENRLVLKNSASSSRQTPDRCAPASARSSADVTVPDLGSRRVPGSATVRFAP